MMNPLLLKRHKTANFFMIKFGDIPRVAQHFPEKTLPNLIISYEKEGFRQTREITWSKRRRFKAKAQKVESFLRFMEYPNFYQENFVDLCENL